MTNNSGSAPTFDTAGLEFDSRRVPFLYSPHHLSFALRHSPNHLGVSFILRHHAKKSGARHFSSSHWQARGKPKAIVRYRSHNHQRSTIRFAWRGRGHHNHTYAQQHLLHQRSANHFPHLRGRKTLPEWARRQHLIGRGGFGRGEEDLRRHLSSNGPVLRPCQVTTTATKTARRKKCELVLLYFLIRGCVNF